MTAVATPTKGATAVSAPEATRTRKAPRQRPGGARIGAYVVIILLAITWLLPFLLAVSTSLKTESDAAASSAWIGPHGITFDAFAKVLSSGEVPLWALNSIVSAVLVTVLTVATSALAAYALARLDFAGRKWLYAIVIASIIVPPQILIIPLFNEMLAFNMVDTYAGLVLPQAVAPAMVFILKRFFEQVPIELEEAARVDGANRLRVFWSIVLPLSRPILAAVSIFVFITAWNNFLWPFLVINQEGLMTLPVGLQTVKNAFGVQYAQNMAMAVLGAAPLIILFLFFQRQIIKGISTTGFGGT